MVLSAILRPTQVAVTLVNSDLCDRVVYWRRRLHCMDLVKKYFAFVKRQLGSSPKAIQTDNRTEYVNNDLKSWLAKQGIMLC